MKNVGGWLKDQHPQMRRMQAQPPQETPGPRLCESDAVSALRRDSWVRVLKRIR